MRSIKAVVLDLDQTLLRNNKNISDYSLKVLSKSKNNGIKVIVATSRTVSEAYIYTKQIMPDIIIANGGAQIQVDGKTIHECFLSCDLANELVSICMKNSKVDRFIVDTALGCYQENKGLPPDPYYLYALHFKLDKPISNPVYKINIETQNIDTANEISLLFPSCSFISFSGEHWYRFAHQNATKMNAIDVVAQQFHISKQEIVAFGDDFSDIEMIKSCGIGVAVKNAINPVKNCADYICDTNENDGVAKWIKNNVLKFQNNH